MLGTIIGMVEKPMIAIIAGHVLAPQAEIPGNCSLVKADQAFNQSTFSVCTACPLKVNAQVYIGVTTTPDPFQSHALTTNAELFKSAPYLFWPDGQFIHWDGC